MNDSFQRRTLLFLIFIVLAFVTVILFVLPPVVGELGGDTGIRPMSNNCFGFKMSAADVYRHFRPGESGFTLLHTSFVYHIDPQKYPDPATPYCLGIDIWYGE